MERAKDDDPCVIVFETGAGLLDIPAGFKKRDVSVSDLCLHSCLFELMPELEGTYTSIRLGLGFFQWYAPAGEQRYTCFLCWSYCRRHSGICPAFR